MSSFIDTTFLEINQILSQVNTVLFNNVFFFQKITQTRNPKKFETKTKLMSCFFPLFSTPISKKKKLFKEVHLHYIIPILVYF